MEKKQSWPSGIYQWTDPNTRTLYMSVPFTWLMIKARAILARGNFLWDKAIIGGPGVYLMQKLHPEFLEGIDNVTIGTSRIGTLQEINPQATRTTYGCIRKCQFCAIGQGIVEPGGFKELDDWPDLPVITDNNLLAASQPHFDRVIDRLVRHGWGDFEQGLDPRLLTEYHAARLAEIKRVTIRLSLDSMAYKDAWESAFEKLRTVKNKKGKTKPIALGKIRSYALVGFDSGPDEAWERCKWIEAHQVKVSPMWYHPLDCLRRNQVTKEQKALGWSDYERRRLFQWFYQHKEAVAGKLIKEDKEHPIKFPEQL